ncbi:MAG: family 43 glycosylhydrolase, partial [Oscillospiraceae bacterium]|nr:family 43 glycosylhydrolase [Oscillospiraceae bacterium]
SESLWGEYKPFTGNPVLANRNLGGYEIQGVGHADLVEDFDGNWWIFHLGFRQISKWEPFHHLGRETFLMPVDFDENGWFTVAGGVTAKSVETLRITAKQMFRKVYTFGDLSSHEWCFLRKFPTDEIVIKADSLKIKSSPDSDDLNCAGSPSFAGLRQKEFDMDLSVTVKVTPNSGDCGLTVYMDENHHYDLVCNGKTVNLMLNVGDIKHPAGTVPINPDFDTVKLGIKSDSIKYSFFADGEKFSTTAQTRYLSSEVACGFTGVVVGFFSQNGNGREYATFTDLRLEYVKN